MEVLRPRPALPAAADLYNDVAPPRALGLRDHLPGLVVAVLATMAAGFLADHYRAPLTLMALLIGLSLNFLGADPRMVPGLSFAARTLLRVGIVLVGTRVTLGQIAALGPETLAAVVLILLATLGAGLAAARLLGLGAAFGALAGGAVAICGASAAMALATTLGERRVTQADLALVLVGVAAASAAAMFAYPLAAHAVGLGSTGAGFMLGAAIHDVAQAIGAGYSVSPAAGEVATVVKLARVALLAPVLAVLAAILRRRGGGAAAGGGGLPWFVVGFFVLAAINSTGAIPATLAGGAGTGATALLACAVAATGIRAPMGALLAAGPRPLLVIAIASAVGVLLATGAAFLLFGRA